MPRTRIDDLRTRMDGMDRRFDKMELSRDKYRERYHLIHHALRAILGLLRRKSFGNVEPEWFDNLIRGFDKDPPSVDSTPESSESGRPEEPDEPETREKSEEDSTEWWSRR